MYRIRLPSREEAVYRTVEELAQAVSSGVVSAHAEVFHKAGNRWLPIITHPDYRALVTGKRPAIPEHLPATPEEPAATFLTPTAPRPAIAEPTPRRSEPVAVPDFVEPAATAEEQPAETVTTNPFDPPRRPVSRGRVLLVGLVGAIGLAAGFGVVLLPILAHGKPADPPAPAQAQSDGIASPADSTAQAPNQPKPASAQDTTPAPAPASGQPAATEVQVRRPDTFTVKYPAPSKPLAPAPAPGSSAPAAGVQPRVSRMTGTVSRLPSYFEAYADARAEMDEGLEYVNFRRVFAASRFSGPDSLRAARRMVQAAGNILRVYRGREVMLEQTYRPGDPDGRGSLRESFEASEASRSLLSDVDSLFGLLVGQQGEYAFRGDAIAFQNRRAAREYANLRRDIMQAVIAWRDSAESPSRVSMPRILRGIGQGFPPPAR